MRERTVTETGTVRPPPASARPRVAGVVLMFQREPCAPGPHRVERSRRLGSTLRQALDRLAERHPVIGDVRGGHGLFAVLELVTDHVSRQPLAPWPQTPPICSL